MKSIGQTKQTTDMIIIQINVYLFIITTEE